MNENLYKVTAEIEFNERKSTIFFRVKARSESEAIKKADLCLAQSYAEEQVSGEFTNCVRIKNDSILGTV